MARWLVDGMNVVGSRPDGWWADRPAAMRRLVSQLERFAESTGDDVTVIFDGQAFDVPEADAVAVAFASEGGRNAADDEIAQRVAADGEPGSLHVVTSDRELIERVGAHGAEVVRASEFRRSLENP